ncbi:hypothetical protein GWK08_13395 [Leptobacterium flavescens]|uniref:Uncharacterized protein n=1 Tax=Leptobacterium flavescens TaxID=472055 RepID=A0A6P0UUF6_9FLAO|nr:hypothetical protein [Leptobacterium flavescens]NER14443.1 hypothetical protein [Leptobacterium flavescens]
MRNTWLFVLLLVFVLPLYAQSSDTRPGFDGKREYIDNMLRSSLNTELPKPLGSPYMAEDFVPAKINHFTTTQLVRYNAASDNMEFRNSKNDILVLNKLNDYTITLNNSKKVYQTVTYTNGKRGFAVLLWGDKDSENALFLKERKEFIPKKVTSNSYGNDQPAKYEKLKDVLYLRGADGTLAEVPLGKKKFSEMFKGKEKEVQQYIKKNNLKIRKQEDIKKVLAFVQEH